MRLCWPENFLQGKRSVWITAAITFFLFLIANLPWQLDDYDQAKQAFTSFEMIKEGRWFYQHTPHEHVATKPPLIGWISAGLFSITRSWDIAWRLPSFLAAVAMAILLFRAATSAYGSVAGLIAFSAFGLNLLSPRLATLVRTDMPLALVIFLIGLLIWEKIRRGTVWKPRDRICLFALLTVAMLIKGPIVYAFLLPGIVVFQWRHGRVGALLRLPKAFGTARRPYQSAPLQSAWSSWWPWVASLAIFLLWAIGGILFIPGFFHEVVVREFAARFAETVHHPQPVYFYLPHLLHKFAPWSVLMIAVAIVDLHTRNWRLPSAFREMSPETFWLLCWGVGGLIAMSLIPSKRVDRIFPVVPPLCLLLASQINHRVGALRRLPEAFGTARRSYLGIALVSAILFTGVYTISKVVAGYRDHRDALAVFGRKVRHEAEARQWRCEVVSAKDEGLLLYLRRTQFIEPDRALAEWNRENIDALVVSTEKAPAVMPQLQGAAVSQLKSNQARDGRETGYVLITR